MVPKTIEVFAKDPILREDVCKAIMIKHLKAK
jgi:hypothetical protein